MSIASVLGKDFFSVPQVCALTGLRPQGFPSNTPPFADDVVHARRTGWALLPVPRVSLALLVDMGYVEFEIPPWLQTNRAYNDRDTSDWYFIRKGMVYGAAANPAPIVPVALMLMLYIRQSNHALLSHVRARTSVVLASGNHLTIGMDGDVICIDRTADDDTAPDLGTVTHLCAP